MIEKARNRAPSSPTQARMPIETLRAFARKQLSAHHVMRALALHDGWFVPIAWASKVFGRTTFQEIVGDRDASLTLEALTAFTSRDAVIEARSRGGVGCFVGPISGCEMLEKLPVETTVFEVNPRLEPSDGWFIEEKPGIELAREYGRAVALERAFDRWEMGVEDRLGAHVFYVFASPQGIATYSDILPFGLLFTSLDAAGYAAGSLPGRRLIRMEGARLFRTAESILGVDGFVVNAFGPDAVNRLIPLEMCRKLAQRAA